MTTEVRIAAAIGLALMAGACRPGETPLAVPTPSVVTSGRMPQVRVGLHVETASITAGATDDYSLSAADGSPALSADATETWTVVQGAAGGLVASSGSRILATPGPITIRSDRGWIRVGERTYRGEASLLAGEAGVTVVNVLELEDYLLGVVPREIGQRPASEIEAVKAQAVAARTYAVANIGGRSRLGFDYYAGTQDQVYGGMQDEDSITSRAVRETRGEVVTWQGVPILAYYSSTCGGRTAAIEDSWPGRAPVPYLKSVSDQIPGTDRHYCDPSNRFRWTVKWTRQQLLEVLGSSLREYAGDTGLPLRAVRRITMRTNGSGRATVDIQADAGEFTLRADSIRWVLLQPGGASLNSSYFESLETTTDGDGAISELTVHGGGWGHAIGMCQFGAIGRARAGQKHTQILSTYYSGTQITRLY